MEYEMVLIGLDNLSGPSKVAILKLCLGNIGFVVFGFLAIAFGGYYIDEYHVTKFVSSYIQGSGPEDVKGLIDVNSHQILLSICIILIAAGVGIVIVSMVGFCGAVQRNPHCMLGYVVFLLILIISESMALGLIGAFRTKVDQDVSLYVKGEILTANYQFGTGNPSGITVAFDVIQMENECCGLIGASDYLATFKNWKSVYGNKRISLPPFCCKFKKGKTLRWNEVLAIESIQNLTFAQIRESFAPFWLYSDCLDEEALDFDKSWTNQGCYDKFQQHVFNKLFWTLVWITIAIVVFEVLCLLSSCILLCDVNLIKKTEAKQEEQNVAMQTERDTILAGMQAAGSMAAFAMTGGVQKSSVRMGPSAMRMRSSQLLPYSVSVMNQRLPPQIYY